MNTSPVTLTEKAVTKVKEFMAKTPDSQGKLFRVAVEGGGCSGYQYAYSLDEKRPDDLVVTCGDVQILVDPASQNLLQGSVVDFLDTFTSSGFSVQNPQSKGSCGCGVSFTV